MQAKRVSALCLLATAALLPGTALAQSGSDASRVEQIGPTESAPTVVEEIDSATLPARVARPPTPQSDDPCDAPRESQSPDVAAACEEAERFLLLNRRPKVGQDSVVVRDEGVFIRIESKDGSSEINLGTGVPSLRNSTR